MRSGSAGAQAAGPARRSSDDPKVCVASWAPGLHSFSDRSAARECLGDQAQRRHEPVPLAASKQTVPRAGGRGFWFRCVGTFLTAARVRQHRPAAARRCLCACTVGPLSTPAPLQRGQHVLPVGDRRPWVAPGGRRRSDRGTEERPHQRSQNLRSQSAGMAESRRSTQRRSAPRYVMPVLSRNAIHGLRRGDRRY